MTISTSTYSSCTSICLRNLPININDQFLAGYIHALVDSPKYEVKLSFRSTAGQTEVSAEIDHGSVESAQQAIRELNGKLLRGNRITASLCLPGFSPLPSQKVSLKQIPNNMINSALYDLLSKFGTIVALDLHYEQTNSSTLQRACVTFFTEEQAQLAIQAINSSRTDESSLTAEPASGFVGGETDSNILPGEPTTLESIDSRQGYAQPPNKRVCRSPTGVTAILQSGRSTESGTSTTFGNPEFCISTNGITDENHPDAVLASGRMQYESTNAPSARRTGAEIVKQLLFDHYIDEVVPDLRFQKISCVLSTSLDADHVREIVKQKDRFHFYVVAAEMALEDKVWKIQQLSAEDWEIIEKLRLPAQWTRDHLLQALRDRLYYEGLGVYTLETFKKSVDIFLAELGVYDLLKLTKDRNFYRLNLFHAKVAIESNSDFVPPSLIEEERSLILNLELDKLDGVAQWQQPLRVFLMQTYSERYGPEQLGRVIEKIFHAYALPSKFYELLHHCSSTDRFPFLVFQAKTLIEREDDVLSRTTVNSRTSDYLKNELDKLNNSMDWQLPTSGAVRQKAIELKFDLLNKMQEWRKAIREYLTNSYKEKYEKDKLINILDTILRYDVEYGVLIAHLELCVMETREFVIIGAAAQSKKQRSHEFSYFRIEENVMDLARKLDLKCEFDPQSWINAMQEYLIPIHEEMYGRINLQQSLGSFLRGYCQNDGLYFCLQMCADEKKFQKHFGPSRRVYHQHATFVFPRSF